MHGLSLVTFGIRTRTYKWTVYTRHEALQEAKLGLYYEAMWKHKQSDETNATKSSPSENFGKFKQGTSHSVVRNCIIYNASVRFKSNPKQRTAR